MEKEEGRRLALERRNAISDKDREQCSFEIEKKVRQQEWYRQSDIVLSYVSFRSEVSTEKINEWILEDGKQLFLPRTYADRHCIEFYRVTDLSLLSAGYQGIPEPVESELHLPALESRIASGENVLMLMPGVAFDEKGNRIGYGGGYYDRYLSAHGEWITNTIMLAFAEQEIPVIESELCDRKPDRIIVNNRL